MRMLIIWIRSCLSRWFGPPEKFSEPLQDGSHLRREIARLVSENDALRGEIQLLGDMSVSDAAASADAQVRKLLKTLGVPISQLLSMADRSAVGIQQFDFAEHARPLIEDLRKKLIPNNVSIIGPASAITPFDPEVHQPYGADNLVSGQPAQILLVGLQYAGEVLQLATVIAHRES